MRMHKFYAQFMTDRDPKQVEEFLIKSLEKAGCVVTYASYRETDKPGRKSINRPKIKEYLKISCQPNDEITLEELVDAVGLSEQATGKVIRKLVSDGHLIKHYTIGSPATYTVVEQYWKED